jgi:hypothetical protein
LEAVARSDDDLQAVFDWFMSTDSDGGQTWMAGHAAGLMSLGIDTDSNIVKVGIQGLTPAIRDALTGRFGEAIDLFEDIPGQAQ